MGCAASSDQPSYSQRTGQGYPVQQTKPVGTVQPNAQALAYHEQQLAQQRQQQLQQQQYQQQLQQQSQQQSVQQQQIQAPPQPQKDQSSPYRPNPYDHTLDPGDLALSPRETRPRSPMYAALAVHVPNKARSRLGSHASLSRSTSPHSSHLSLQDAVNHYHLNKDESDDDHQDLKKANDSAIKKESDTDSSALITSQHPAAPQTPQEGSESKNEQQNGKIVSQTTTSTTTTTEIAIVVTQPEIKDGATRQNLEPEKDPNNKEQVAQVEITKEILQRYVELEKKTHELEDQNIVKSLKMKTEQLNEIKLNVEMYEKQYAQCVEQTVKELQDVYRSLADIQEFNSKKEKDDVDKMQEPSVKDFFNDQAAFDTQLSKEQEEYLEALNKQEVTEKALDGAKKQHEKVAAEVAGLKVEAEELYAIYKEQDELLAKLFGGKYGSDLEYKLETELDMLLDRKQRIGVAKYKWQNGRVLLNHACNQLAFASKRWQDLPKVQANNTQMKYQVATETRNNLIAASQNITSAQQYLNTIQFPYCKPEEIATLDKAAQNIYTDMQTPERQAHALQCYSTTHRRSAALIQWFDYVISSTIVKDMHSATVDVNKKEKQLRDERLRLIKAKVSEHLDEDVDALFQSNEEYEDPVEAADREVAMMFEADDVSDSGDLPGGDPAMPEGLEAPGAGMKAPTPMPLDQLAPAPGTTDLFGNIDELKKQHEQEIEEFNRAQEMNKVRMDQGLQEKLMARRSRRARQTAQPPAV